MRTLVINDLHFGCRRRGGTTQQSREALESWMFEEFEALLQIPHDRVIIAGDLFDTRQVQEHIMLRLINNLKTEDCTIMLGNHCLGGINDGTISSTEFVGAMAGCTVVREPVQDSGGIYMIPHLFNQEQHEQAIAEVPDGCILITHCNVSNAFAQGDHSLNLSEEEISVLRNKKVRVLAAHEHNPRRYREAIEVIGCQYPTTISDCLNKQDKRCVVIEDGEISFIETWKSADSFWDVPYTALDTVPDRAQFVRVHGEATKADFPKVVQAVDKLRRSSNAFVVSNAVDVIVDNVVMSAEDVTGINVIELLVQALPEKFRERVVKCISSGN